MGDRYRPRAHTIAPNREESAEPVTRAMECMACGEKSPSSEDYVEPQGWVFVHLRAHPAHLDYLEHLTRPYRVTPGPWL
ncbi:hypothetical protein [Streptomyces silvensis]|uniref:DUF7848 domain-containing protein n=1 Tax=Streptomyces silvensis TaxID=1765722 RepID=A0A0W7X945_9ACTN|nr:hypothetical protein [Streptomyces silvensis]KUF19497.1 hypothetical protein AT728_03690 [Streptomyces silvensis]